MHWPCTPTSPVIWPGCGGIAVRGEQVEEVDITNAAGLRAALLEAAAHGSRTLVADMAQTQFCDSAGLNVLVRAHQRAQADGGELLLVICTAPSSASSRSPASAT